MKPNLTFTLLVLLAIMPVLVFSQNLSNASVHKVSIGRQDYPLYAYILPEMNNDVDSDIVFCSISTLDINKAVYKSGTSDYDVSQIIASANPYGTGLILLAVGHPVRFVRL